MLTIESIVDAMALIPWQPKAKELFAKAVLHCHSNPTSPITHFGFEMQAVAYRPTVEEGAPEPLDSIGLQVVPPFPYPGKEGKFLASIVMAKSRIEMVQGIERIDEAIADVKARRPDLAPTMEQMLATGDYAETTIMFARDMYSELCKDLTHRLMHMAAAALKDPVGSPAIIEASLREEALIEAAERAHEEASAPEKQVGGSLTVQAGE
jgi:hypothetical protein